MSRKQPPAPREEVWVAWVNDGDWGESEMAPVIRRSAEGAKAWCNENRKLSDVEGGTGNPIQWHGYRNGNAWDGTARLFYPSDGKVRTVVRHYRVEMHYLED